MVKLKPDIIAKLKLYSKEEGGPSKNIPPVQFGCPLFFEGEYFDCRLLVDQLGTSIELGTLVTVPIKFLDPEFIKPRLCPGKHFKLWEMKFIGEGEVVGVIT